MTAVPQDPAIYHITHVGNLAGIVREGGIWCDAERIARKLVSTNIGHNHIKQRRMRCRVRTRADGMLGEYVPFNFCPRSVMLFAVDRGHQDYAGGQDDVVHLVSSVSTAVALGRDWAFTDRHAELGHALHFDDLSDLGEVPWHTMDLTYWAEVREERQAEFLVRELFPWEAVREIGVISEMAHAAVLSAIGSASHQPAVHVRHQWYY